MKTTAEIVAEADRLAQEADSYTLGDGSVLLESPLDPWRLWTIAADLLAAREQLCQLIARHLGRARG